MQNEKEKIISLNKDKFESAKKYEENQEKQELKEKESIDKDENRWKNNQKLGVDYHTQKEIKNFIKDDMKSFNEKVEYTKQQKTSSPYNSGIISQKTMNKSIKTFNTVRFIAGLSYNIGVKDEYNKLAQDASLLMSVNNLLEHHGQPKPKNMDKKLYDSGSKGCSSCNIGSGDNNINSAILGWLADEHTVNFDNMGHRRWILNPPMKNTGFGFVNKFDSMYCFDKGCPENNNKNVAWPAQNTPIEFFGDNYPWTLSIGENINKQVTVTLINKKTKKVIKFDKYINDKFAVNNGNFGQEGCIIFRPNLKYSDGDAYRVDINCTNFSVSYDVNFFSLNCTHENKDKELIGTIKSSCENYGKKIYFCNKCGITTESPLSELEEHDKEVISITEATCAKEGKKIIECLTCCRKWEYSTEIKPHDYIIKPIENNSKVEGSCKICKKKVIFQPPTFFRLWWRNGFEGNFSGIPFENNPVGSVIFCWIEGVDGDDGFRQFIVEVSDPTLLQIPDEIENTSRNQFKVLNSGDVELAIYPKYNPAIKRNVKIHLG